MANTIEIVIRATDDASKVIAKLEGDVTASTGLLIKNFDSVGKASQTANQKLQDFGKGMSSLGGKLSIGVTLPLAAAGAAALKMGMDMEQTSVAFKTLVGSTEAAQKHLDDLRAFAASTPFEFTELTQASKRMMAFGFEAEKIVPMLRDIGDATSALGMGSEGIDRITRALGQMQAKGKVSGEEMMQLTEAGIPGWKYLAEAMGVTTAEVMKMSERGLIPAGKAVDALLAGMRKDFGGMMAEQSKTAAGQLSNLVDSITEVGTSFGEVMLPTVKSAIDVVRGMVDGLKGMSPEMQQTVITTAALAAAMGPLLKIGGSLIGVFTTLRGGVIDAAGGMISFGKNIGDVAVYLKDAGISARTLKDAFQYLKAGGGLLGIELGVIVTGLIAVAKYLGEVDAASKATTDDLIEMSRSGDVFKQAAATTEILTNGQNRLKVALDGVRSELEKGDKSYDDYRSSIEATAKAAGYQIDAQGNLIKINNTGYGVNQQLIQSNYALSKSEYEAGIAAHQRGGIIDKGLQGLINLGRQINDVRDLQATATGATYKYADGMRALAEATQAGSDAQKEFREWIQKEVVAPKMESLNIGISGAIKNEIKQYGDSQEALQKRLKDTAEELRNLQREQGAVDKSTTKNAMSAAELEQAQARLADTQTRLSKETDPGKQRELAASIAVQQEKISGANQSVVTYIDNSKRIADLKSTYDDINSEISKNAKAHEDATNRIIYGYAEQAIAAYNAQHGIIGMTDNQVDALNKLAVKMGIKSEEDVKAFNAIREAAANLAKDGNINTFAYNVVRASDDAQGAAGRIVSSMYPVGNAIDTTALKALNLMDTMGRLTAQPYVITLQYHEQNIPTLPGRTTPLPGGAQRGADFIVPPGYSNDSFPMRVSSGEHVQVTPRGQGGGQVPPINITQNFSGAQSSPEQYKAIMYEVITNVFETAMRQ